ncbi:thiosulfate sulfurtransferase GlpE [Simiduia agarivorans]|uniref:Thiosulfate sulfurtransferase GlpE n=1 Tax=Simiduia agarivorans (strain DSM 21679 / JCM 13881 / BCRC 17597 / SA1) TaxID=1117647 RepID=K4KLC7_SIMAS|nr:thiosulfate sulfurtransferase GlpE [Simiduia agarivorans]AFU98863.1 rhodanese domain-containing protein [Simiduia agarivorans SA1 = DSM 21679]
MPGRYARIDPQQAHQLMQAPVCIVDIRDPQSFQAGHIRGATHLSNDNLSEFLSHQARNQPVLVCCYHGNSSQGAAQFLAEQGFETTYSLNGGFSQWSIEFPDQCAQGASE